MDDKIGMMNEMVFKLAIFTVIAFASAHAASNGEYIITHTPSHITFLKEAKQILNSEIPDVIASTYGFTVAKDLKWNGLAQTSLFARPKANVIVSVDGVPSALNIKHHSKYEAQRDDPVINAETIVNKLQTNMAANPLIVDFAADKSMFDIKSEHPSLFRDLPGTASRVRQLFQTGQSGFSPDDLGSLNITEDADLIFLGELTVIKGLIEALRREGELAGDSVPDFFHLHVGGLRGLLRRHGASAAQVKDALRLLQATLDEVTSEFVRLYSGNLVVQVVTTPTGEEEEAAPAPRSRRSLMQAAPGGGEAAPGNDKAGVSTADSLGLAPKYSEDYAVIFNIILWGGITLGLALLAIAYAIWNMDPGKDSIIYRMTSQRMKKD